MQVVSGPMGRETIHFQAPDAINLQGEMSPFLTWFNDGKAIDPLLKAAIAHLWFITIHPFDDGNGRIARAIADMQLARADNSTKRFYSMSMQIRKEHRQYYAIFREEKHNLNLQLESRNKPERLLPGAIRISLSKTGLYCMVGLGFLQTFLP